ncbi:uncharacterized protein K460DRAFT_405357 [Cucurbitaria berberidis CBS 394.84]|uniref:DUF7580 domain-containing protein n=1 Tax=Cucurbitaria berberidis CBS 394.84 TaxID=1168544 RepID=A0A9P4GH60_9PLEO|nr:uncharacterized protein K460DRAFT_405357 [Cucurbitaria berberidis CBS 394.84]KAF1845080.1 hypothetical protein K460DRAFT_405357 [Cucurbitaria berberidis CBS 394.84]
MSGVEIAGLALAVLPILIAAAEHAKSRRLEPRRAEFMENLAFEITLLHMSLTRLAKGLSELSDELREKLSSPQASQDLEESWKSTEVVHALKKRLGSGHETFVVTVGAILACLEKLLEKKSLGLSNEETTFAEQTYAKLDAIRHRTSSTPINALSHRVRFAIHEAKKYGQILTKIKENNERLEKIVLWAADTVFATPELPKNSRPVGSPHIQLRPLMHTLHAALGGLWPCDCPGKHEARLCLLQHRDQRRDSMTTDTGEGDNVYFNMLMSLRSAENEPYCRWLESQLCIALQEDIAPQPTRGVRFELDTTSSPIASGGGIEMITISTGNTEAALPRRRRASTATRRKIEKLCHTLLQAERNLCSPQILFDGGCLWHVTSKQTSRRSSRTLSVQGSEVDTSLASLLRGERKFRPKEKRILSVILANSLLHFCESPWLSKEWSKEHISFFSTAEKGGLDIHRPYLSTNFQAMVAEVEPDTFYRIHANPSVLALGILLLEIELDSPIERERGVQDLDEHGKPNVNTDYFAALRLFEGIADDIYQNHRQAVSACLNCDFYDEETMEPSLDNPEFRQAVYNNIVRPLEQELYSAYDLTPDDLGLNLV